MDKIEVRGARTHNLKNINLVIPRDKLIVITGLSGSGKSSLAFDTLYAEGQRRYVESLSAYARQFLSLMENLMLITLKVCLPLFRLNRNLRHITHVQQWERLLKYTITYVFYLHVLVSLVVLIMIFH